MTASHIFCWHNAAVDKSKEIREAWAVIVGGVGLFFAVALAALYLLNGSMAAWAVAMVAVIVWREFVFAGMRAELEQLRRLTSVASKP